MTLRAVTPAIAEPLVRPDRIPCIVIGCRRTAARAKYPEGTIIICGKCFRLAPKHLRRRDRRLCRILRRLNVECWEDTAPGSVGRRALILHCKVFDEIVKRATEARVGIG